VCLIKAEYFLVGGDIPVNNETSMVTSSISRLSPPTQSFGGGHRDRVCVRTFIEVSVCVCI
jgi:hypothetical protein